VPGATIKKSKTTQQVVKSNGSLLEANDLLAATARQAWFAAIEEFINAVNETRARAEG
jgi:hypothetical protein